MQRERFLALLLLLSASATAQAQGMDLLAGDRYRTQFRISAYVPKVPVQITRIRSDAEATSFCLAAWGEDKKDLHIDFDRDQVLAVAWGALRFDESSAGSLTDIVCEDLRLVDDMLKVRLRTVIPPGPGIDLPLDAKAAGRTWYPSLFLKAPRTDRVVVDVVGSRRRDPARDFAAVTEKALEVRVLPDETPLREKITLLGTADAFDAPRVAFEKRGDAPILEVGWGKLASGAYRLDVIAAAMQDGVLQMTVRAENRPIAFYSGPGEHWPSLRLRLPVVDAVRLHIVRTGIPLPAATADFTASKSSTLTVTVDDTNLIQR